VPLKLRRENGESGKEDEPDCQPSGIKAIKPPGVGVGVAAVLVAGADVGTATATGVGVEVPIC